MLREWKDGEGMSVDRGRQVIGEIKGDQRKKGKKEGETGERREGEIGLRGKTSEKVKQKKRENVKNRRYEEGREEKKKEEVKEL